ncbi:L-rhamnose mutarotase [Devosia algicola]|uniref:L-rhamnose mutarotase n=1 Tax=Devosia algicola TaxID=3026418 RepID=A0ABY7YLX4_9HYPH|nr:L-rhamnose mutarotase [Devosia algicola]WDR01950.1 L-rhamnose mutarotase [Devosia algicola]
MCQTRGKRRTQVQRMGMVLGVKANKIDEYKRLHADVWPEILALLSTHNITNYTIFLKEPENLLFGYWEYTGADFEVDSKAIADDPKNEEWWSVCMPCQQPLEHRKSGEWWAMMEPVFHTD